MNMEKKPLVVWLLTSSEERDTEFLSLPSVRSVEFLGLPHLLARYGREAGGIEDFQSKWDLWRYSVFDSVLQLAQERGEMPDLLETGSTWTIAVSPLLYDITDIAEEDDVDATNTFLSRALRSCRPDEGQPYAERYYSLPFTLDCRTLFFTHPFQEEHIRSWNAFETWLRDDEVLNQLKAKGARFGVQMGDDGFHDILVHIWACGGDVVRASDLRVMLDSPETIEAMMRLVHLVHLGIAPLQTPETHSLHDARMGLSRGNLHASIGSLWLNHPIPGYTLPKFRVTLPPRGRHRAGFVGGTNLGVVRRPGYNRREDYADAIELLKYLCLDDYVLRKYGVLCPILKSVPAWEYCQRMGKLPPQTRVLQRWLKDLEDPRLDIFVQALLAPDHLRLPSIAQMASIEEHMKICVVEVWKRIAGEGQVRNPQTWEPKCRAIVTEEFRKAAVHLRRAMESIVRVRVRDRESQYFAERGIWGRADATTRFPTSRYDLLVDEGRGECIVQLVEEIDGRDRTKHKTIKAGEMSGSAWDMLVCLVRSESGVMPLPQMLGSMEQLYALLCEWRQQYLLPKRLGTSVPIANCRAFLARLMESNTNVQKKLPGRVEDTIRNIQALQNQLDSASLPASELSARIDALFLDSLGSFADYINLDYDTKRKDSATGNLAVLRKHLGERFFPNQSGHSRTFIQLPDKITASLLLPYEIKKPDALADRLRAAKPEHDPVSVAIREYFLDYFGTHTGPSISNNTRNHIQRIQAILRGADDSAPRQRQKYMADGLNVLLLDNNYSLHRVEWFQDVMTPEIHSLVTRALEEEERIILHRLLLDQIYPHEISRRRLINICHIQPVNPD